MKYHQITIFKFRNFRIELIIRVWPNPQSPYDCGDADQYYGRKWNPRFWDKWGRLVGPEKMTIEQIEEYRDGFETPEDEKIYKRRDVTI